MAFLVASNLLIARQSISRVPGREASSGNSSLHLLGQFNWDATADHLSRWVDAWGRVVDPQNIHPYVPNVVPDERATVYPAPDKGYYSPYKNLANKLRSTPVGSSVLYVHDDLIVRASAVKKLGSAWKYTGSMFELPWPAKTHYKWHWAKTCYASIRSIEKAGVVQRLIGQPFPFNSDKASLLRWGRGQSDMLYARNNNSTLTTLFCDLLDEFYRRKLFLECALPTALHIMQSLFGVETENLSLCTNWGKHRKNMIESKCYQRGGFDVLHPVKNSIFFAAFDHINPPLSPPPAPVKR